MRAEARVEVLQVLAADQNEQFGSRGVGVFGSGPVVEGGQLRNGIAGIRVSAEFTNDLARPPKSRHKALSRQRNQILAWTLHDQISRVDSPGRTRT